MGSSGHYLVDFYGAGYVMLEAWKFQGGCSALYCRDFSGLDS